METLWEVPGNASHEMLGGKLRRLMEDEKMQPWFCSILASMVIGLAGVVPLVVIPDNYASFRKAPTKGADTLNLLLSFAVGGLLTDVFLHLLPEAWALAIEAGLAPQEAFRRVGICVLCGVFLFIVVEILASGSSTSEDDKTPDKYEKVEQRNGSHNCNDLHQRALNQKMEDTQLCQNNNNNNVNGNIDKKTPNGVLKNNCDIGENFKEADDGENKIEVVGYLNLVANGIDNFCHGLAVAAAFMVCFKTGLLTTAAILVHEVPHEIGDFAILLSSGFSRWQAAKAQLYTAGVGLLGSLFTLTVGSSQAIGHLQVYVLGFTGGAFLHISLCSVLPGLLVEARPKQSLHQLAALLAGAAIMAWLTNC